MKFDVIGRIKNMRLPDGKAAVLYSVYEAVSNSLHAIEDRFGTEDTAEKGRIVIDVTIGSEGYIDSITIEDNGTGFTSNNLDAFDTCDTRFKETRGGKGIGRLIWIKVFEEIKVESRFIESEIVRSISFNFVPEHEPSIRNQSGFAPDTLIQGTRVILNRVRGNQKGKIGGLRSFATSPSTSSHTLLPIQCQT